MEARDGFKVVCYRGVLVQFLLPEHWVEEYEAAGGGTFFDPSDEAITLRLNVMTMESPRDVRVEDAAGVLAEIPEIAGGKIETLKNGQVMCALPVQAANGGGTAIELHTWAVGRVVPPRTVRLAMFSVTVVPGLAGEKVQGVLAMLAERVRECEISDAALVKAPSLWKRIFG